MDISILSHELPTWAAILVAILAVFFGAFFQNFDTVIGVARDLLGGSRSRTLKGEWTGLVKELRPASGTESGSTETVRLSQRGARVRGSIETNSSLKRRWDVDGFFKNDILVLNYLPSDKKETRRTLGALVVEGNPQNGMLKGCWVGYDNESQQVVAGPYILTNLIDTGRVSVDNNSWLATPMYAPGRRSAKVSS